MASTATTGDVAVGAEVDPQPADVAVVADVNAEAEANGADQTQVDTAGDAVVAANGMTQRHAGKPAAADEAVANGNGHGDDGEDQEEDDAEEYAGMRSRSISQALDTIAGVTASKRRIKLGFENIQFKVGNKQILNGVSGAIRPGGLCAIMGPSGAGKSTLLNILAGRTRSKGKAVVKGTVRANGRVVDPLRFRKRIAYVMQEDALFATQTPREALDFSAALRLPKSVTPETRTKLVEEMLTNLGLTKCADTLIGSVMIPGISGGEKKRTAIGVELISNPDILFLDEPTSGLDSYAAYQVVKILKKLSHEGRTIITTIHQPSSEVFDLFDQVLLLTAGDLLYHDSRMGMTKYFGALGNECPAHYNPADYIMFVMQQADAARVETLRNAWRDYSASKAAENGTAVAGVGVTLGAGAGAGAAAAGSASSSGFGAKIERAGFCTQFGKLAWREMQNVVRDKGALGARIGSTVFLNLIVGFVFMDAARWDDVDGSAYASVMDKVNTNFGALIQVAIGGLFGLSQPTLLSFPVERPVFIREYATNTYSLIPYFLSKMLVEIPMMIFQSSLMFLCAYWLVGFNGGFFQLTLVIALLGFVSASTTLAIGAAVENVTAALQLTPLLFVPQLLFAGFFIPITSIPEWLQWPEYLCSLKYSINIVTIVEFDQVPAAFAGNEVATNNYLDAVYGCHGDNLVDGNCIDTSSVAYRTALLPRTTIDTNDSGLYLAILLAVLVAFRAIALIALRCKARP